MPRGLASPGDNWCFITQRISMFLVAFALFIRVFTSFQSLIWGLVFLIITVGGVSLYAFFAKKGLKS